jgi:hypothetical protein
VWRITDFRDKLAIRHTQVQQKYFDPDEDLWSKEIVLILRRMPRAELARLASVSERYIQYLLNGAPQIDPRSG